MKEIYATKKQQGSAEKAALSFCLFTGLWVSVCAILACPLRAEAAYAGGLLECGGICALLDVSYTADEYVEIAENAQGATYGYTNIGIAQVESGNLNVREEPSTSGTLVGKLPKNAACEVLFKTDDGWAYITSGEVEGYVSLDYLVTGVEAKILAADLVRTVAVANTDGLNIRTAANTLSSILTQVLKGEELEYVQTLENGWVEVSIDGDTAYVSGEFVDVEEKLDTAITMSELLYGQGVSDLRVSLVEYAKQFVGNPYVWGGTSLTKGADCSGFVMSVFAHFGISLSHSSRAQANEGKSISASELQPGDLVFYSKNGTINHVAIYIGNGQVIHASSPSTGIKISKYNYRTPTKYVRIIND